MGFFTRITNKIKGVTAAHGNHSIDSNSVLAPTDSQAVNPNQPGQWQSIRTAPVNHTPRYFTKQDADAAYQLRKHTTEGARQAKRVYKHMARVEHNDADVHKHHRKYLGNVADAELTKISSNTKLARHLHALRPRYAQLGQGLTNAEQSATEQVNRVKSKIRGNF